MMRGHSLVRLARSFIRASMILIAEDVESGTVVATSSHLTAYPPLPRISYCHIGGTYLY